MEIKTPKIIGCWVACAVFLSFGVLQAQEDEIDVPKSNTPIEAKEQKGTVLGSLQKTINQFPLPSVIVNTGFQTKQFKRGVMWDQNTNADVDISLRWYPTENSSLSIGLNGRAPTRNSRRKYLESIKSKGPSSVELQFYPSFIDYYNNQNALVNVFNLSPVNEVQTWLKKQRDENELDESEFTIGYTYTFKDVSIFGDISISGGWSLFKENDIYAKIKSNYYFGNALGAFGENFIEHLQTRANLFWLGDYVKTRIAEENAQIEMLALQNAQGIEQALQELGLNSVEQLTDSQRSSLINNLLNFSEKINLAYQQWAAKTAWLNTGSNVLDAQFKENYEQGKEDIAISNYDFGVRREIKWRETSRNEFKFALSLDNILHSNIYAINPNMSINFETNGHFWLQYGINNSIPIGIISDKLVWNTSIDTYWFDHDYFKVSDRWNFYYYFEPKNAHNSNYSLSVSERKEIENKLNNRMLLINKLNTRTAHSRSGFKTLSIRTSLDYAIRPNLIVSPNISAIRWLDGLLEHSKQNEWYYFNEHYAVWCGINLLFTF